MKILFLFFICMSGIAFGQQKISDAEIKSNLQKEITYCDKVHGTFITNGKKKVIFLNLGSAYPAQKLTVAIFEGDWKKFDYKPAEHLKGKTICVSGKLILYKDKPEIIVNNPKQIKIQ